MQQSLTVGGTVEAGELYSGVFGERVVEDGQLLLPD